MILRLSGPWTSGLRSTTQTGVGNSSCTVVFSNIGVPPGGRGRRHSGVNSIDDTKARFVAAASGFREEDEARPSAGAAPLTSPQGHPIVRRNHVHPHLSTQHPPSEDSMTVMPNSTAARDIAYHLHPY